jgi:hypothetical protein
MAELERISDEILDHFREPMLLTAQWGMLWCLIEKARARGGPIHHMASQYGSCEMSITYPACEAGHYHVIPWVIPFVLDVRGERLLEHGGGVVEGRCAFLGLSYNARWGSLISGDKLTMNYAEKCICGRPGPVVMKDSICCCRTGACWTKSIGTAACICAMRSSAVSHAGCGC